MDSYSAGTTIGAGTLQLGSGGTTGAIAGDVADNGTLAFDRADVITFGGAITGNGAVSQIGTGTTTLTGTNTYSGGTTINGRHIDRLGQPASAPARSSTTGR